MAKPSLAGLNAEFAHHGFELVKGDGYFYFYGLTEETGLLIAGMKSASVMVCHFTHMPISRWRAAMADFAVALDARRAELAEPREPGRFKIGGAAAQRREVAQMRRQP